MIFIKNCLKVVQNWLSKYHFSIVRCDRLLPLIRKVNHSYDGNVTWKTENFKN
jgi:membrane protein DedA with SNARE-associated domain